MWEGTMAEDDRKARVARLQRQLATLGYNAGRQDGIFGPRTEQALQGFQRDYGLPEEGLYGPATVRALEQLFPDEE
jgi:N-acetylmuramoyl-L-alanine amidase